MTAIVIKMNHHHNEHLTNKGHHFIVFPDVSVSTLLKFSQGSKLGLGEELPDAV